LNLPIPHANSEVGAAAAALRPAPSV